MERAREGLTVRAKLLLAVGTSFALASAAVVFVADRVMTAKANEQEEQLFSERLDSIFGLLQERQGLLAKTGMAEAYREGFQGAAREELAAHFYSGPHSNAYPYILDSQGRVVLHPRLKAGDDTSIDRDFIKKILTMKAGNCEYQDSGTSKWCMFRTFAPWDWTVVYTVSLHDKYEAVYQFRATFLAIMGLTALGVLGVLAGLISLATKPIRQLTLATSRMAAGDLDQKVDMTRRDEIGTLARSFAEMGDAIRAKIRNLDREIAEREQAQETLREKTAFLEAQVEACLDGILIVDDRGQMVLKSRRFLDIMKIPPHIAAERSDSASLDYVVSRMKNSQQFLDKVRYLYAHRDLTSRDELELQDGTILDRYSSPVVGSEGRYYGRIWTFRDVTERRRAQEELAKLNRTLEQRVEQRTADLTAANEKLQEHIRHREQAQADLRKAHQAAEAANAAKSDFLANMSHEIRTPLNGVIGMLDLLGHTDVTNQQDRYVSTARRSADMLLTVINDILDFSKIEAGKLSLESVPFDLRKLADDVGQVLAANARGKDVELIVHYPPSTPRWVTGDPARVRQVLTNLAGNAVKFTAHGHVLIHVACDGLEHGRADLHVRVQDTGIGIPPEKLASVFDKFTQADSSTTRRFGGTGLGLAICRMLVQMMKGRIWAESQVASGSTFHFVLPLPLAEEPAMAVLPAGDAALRGLRVLVADDHPVNRQILQEMLESWQAVPTVVDGGAAALELLRSGRGDPALRFGLVILDGQMPGMDGFEVARRILDEKLPVRGPVMMLTSMLHGPQAEQCRRMGIRAYLVKPVRQAELLEEVLTALGRQAPRREPPSAGPASGPSLRILVAEDNDVNQEVIRELLGSLGHTVAIAENGRRAVYAAFAEPFDVILMDVQMPEMDGFEATAEIRRMERIAGGHRAIIAMTANAMKGDEEHCLRAGMDAYVSKPIDIERVCRAIESVLAGRAAEAPPGEGTRRQSAGDGRTPIAGGAAGEPKLDYDALRQRCLGNDEIVRKVLRRFLESAEGTLDKLEQAMTDNQTADACRHAHSLKGAAANLAAEPIRRKAAEMEQLLHNGAHAAAASGLLPLRLETAQCLDRIRTILSQPPAPAEK